MLLETLDLGLDLLSQVVAFRGDLGPDRRDACLESDNLIRNRRERYLQGSQLILDDGGALLELFQLLGGGSMRSHSVAKWAAGRGDLLGAGGGGGGVPDGGGRFCNRDIIGEGVAENVLTILHDVADRGAGHMVRFLAVEAGRRSLTEIGRRVWVVLTTPFAM